MPEIISTPSKGVVEGEDRDHHFAYFETQNKRVDQEDALAWHTLGENQLKSLSPRDIAMRLWTTVRRLDERAKELDKEAGSTACITVFDGKDHVISASVGDSVAFLVAYGKTGEVISATRLNSTLHHPVLQSEKERILKAGGHIDARNRLNGVLAVSRAIGDYDILDPYGRKLAISDAAVDIASISQLLQEEDEPISKIQLISTCDGFTDGAKDNSIESHVMYLLTCLARLDKPGLKTEAEVAAFLAACAIKSNSTDNISIAVQTLVYGLPVFLGVYDGHGGKQIAHEAAMSGSEIFLEQCHLSQEAYEQQPLSAVQPKQRYEKENEKAMHFIAKNPPYFLEKASPLINESALDEKISTLSLKENSSSHNGLFLEDAKSSLCNGFFSNRTSNKNEEKQTGSTNVFLS
ncbi:PP2C family serine/threonine-protein phosphatase [Legionella erythra]|uniref:Protein phosphatase 2C n=1 Tax=Legionella erythra TaxID=448 RepID=A0A0W0TUU2_LEGER|nr:PP2C family protein-serine/threonine phosphatase [Legionella erythra]KTC99176.1 Protein phosphatase 2C [Legionella erythra]